MIRFNRSTRTLIIKLPSWRDRRWVAGLLFVLLVDILVSFIDRPLAEAMRNLSDETHAALQVVTHMGDSKYILVTLVLVLPFLFAARQALEEGSLRRMLTWGVQSVLFLFVAIAGSGLFVDFLKGVVGRTRPKLWFEAGEYGFAPFTFAAHDFNSMPSGHSNTALAFATALGFFFPRLRPYLFIGATVAASSRVIIGAHYLSDVLVGGLIGVLTTLWLRQYVTRKGWVFVRQRGAYRLAAPGYLLGIKLRGALWRYLRIPDGARGRLP